MENSKIEWTHHTFNPWWGCEKVSPACDRCYAESTAKRFGHKVWGNNAHRRLMSDSYWRQPIKWNHKAICDGVRRRVFCASMADVFEDRRDLDGPRRKLWALIEDTPALDWLLLTKRPQNINRMVSWGVMPKNVWVGTTAENRRRWHERIAALANVGAHTTFVSMEPLLEPVDLTPALAEYGKPTWIIVGGETGPGARYMDPDWARSIRDQCGEYGIKFFMKQMTNRKPIPDDLMVREFPNFETPISVIGRI